MAQELEKLAALRASGALSDEEYAAAKARVLSGS
ncbi:SHOCT domain-containing protein [Tsuneonella suprasediminis]|uniref:SHOCT domain-containing protein n=2 Tax=Tsuneonella suprasediminis TaxID=2306996 RepID=A0A419R2N3_9SPHN|nr:SHOCT domain-containing protein [Tsuneonella suprasediminis]